LKKKLIMLNCIAKRIKALVLILGQPVLLLNTRVLIGAVTITNFIIVFGLTQPVIEPHDLPHRRWHNDHYVTTVIQIILVPMVDPQTVVSVSYM
jgi:hypothetical protein